MNKNEYFLIVQDNKKFKIIKVNLFDKSKDNRSLTDIDNFTLKFNSKEELTNYLYDNKYIDSIATDAFIVKRRGKNFNYLEVIYNNNSKLSSKIKNITSNGINNCRNDVSYILMSFIRKMYSENFFYYYIVFGHSNVYKKFYEKFTSNDISIDNYISNMSHVKWVYSSYELVRNMYDAIDRYDKRHTTIDTKSRSSIKKRLYDETDKDNIEGQISLYDYFGEKVYGKNNR